MGIVTALSKAPKTQVILGSFAGSCVLAGLFHGILLSSGKKPHTMSENWKNANKEYMKFQKNNPIFGISRGL